MYGKIYAPSIQDSSTLDKDGCHSCYKAVCKRCGCINHESCYYWVRHIADRKVTKTLQKIEATFAKMVDRFPASCRGSTAQIINKITSVYLCSILPAVDNIYLHQST